MKTNNNQGFTLIELIMVIVILGILSAVAVPKFFSLTDQAHTKNKAAVIGNIKAGLNLFAANALVEDGSRKFPDDGAFRFSAVLDEAPSGWKVRDSSGVGAVIGYNLGQADEDNYLYVSDSTALSASYTITNLGSLQ